MEELLPNPNSVEEWGAYIGGLTGSELWSKALAANTLSFVRDLQEEGYPARDIADILTMFALQFEADGQIVPSEVEGQYLSYSELLTNQENSK